MDPPLPLLLLFGPGPSGKTTTALALIGAFPRIKIWDQGILERWTNDFLAMNWTFSTVHSKWCLRRFGTTSTVHRLTEGLTSQFPSLSDEADMEDPVAYTIFQAIMDGLDRNKGVIFLIRDSDVKAKIEEMSVKFEEFVFLIQIDCKTLDTDEAQEAQKAAIIGEVSQVFAIP